MNKIFLIFSFITLSAWMSCNSNSNKKNTDSSNAINDPTQIDNKQKAINAQMAEGERPDSEQETPSPIEERIGLSKTYNVIKIIDTTLMAGPDTLHLHLKYYCIKDSDLIIPKKYVFGEKSPKDFITHNFASDIKITQKGQIIFNKTIRKNSFDTILTEQLKNYGMLMMPYLSSSNGNKNQIVLDYSISIPASEIGTSVSLIINKNGDSKIAKN